MTHLLSDGRIEGRNLRGVGGACIPARFVAGDGRYVIDDESCLREQVGDRVLFVVDAAVTNCHETQDLVRRFGGVSPVVMALPCGESLKDFAAIDDIIAQIRQEFSQPPDTVMAIGGGTLINTANALVPLLSMDAARLHWQERPLITPDRVATKNYIVVPTTILSVADVAYGSKGNLNAEGQKHAYKLYFNPTAIFLDPRYAEHLSVAEVKSGLVECLKHALLQDQGLPQYAPSFDEVAGLLLQEEPERQCSYRSACQTLYAKSGLLGLDDREESWRGILLSYGHLHAHAHEMASGYGINHGEAVLLGMLTDQKLCGSANIYGPLMAIAAAHPLADKVSLLQAIDAETMEDAYRREPKGFFRAALPLEAKLEIVRRGLGQANPRALESPHFADEIYSIILSELESPDRGYKVLALSRIGQYAGAAGREEDNILTFSWEKIAKARWEVLQDIAAAASPYRHIAPLRRARNWLEKILA